MRHFVARQAVASREVEEGLSIEANKAAAEGADPQDASVIPEQRADTVRTQAVGLGEMLRLAVRG